MDRKSSDKHISTPLTGKNQPNPGKKSMSMSYQTQQKSENSPLTAKKKNGE